MRERASERICTSCDVATLTIRHVAGIDGNDVEVAHCAICDTRRCRVCRFVMGALHDCPSCGHGHRRYGPELDTRPDAPTLDAVQDDEDDEPLPPSPRCPHPQFAVFVDDHGIWHCQTCGAEAEWDG